MEVTLYLAKQGISFRGHYEDEASKNRGNFLELIEKTKNDIPEFKTWLERDRRTTYLSADTQNDIISILAKQLINKLKPKTFFAIIMDETRDLGRIEQMAFCTRHVDDDFQIHEHFLGFWEAVSTKSAALFELLEKFLYCNTLDIKKIVAQNYDGASNMSGEFTGLCTRVLGVNAMALYIHCYAHKFNLALQDASLELTYLRDIIAFTNSLVTFMNGSGPRHSLFKSIQIKNDGYSTALVHLSQTRWGSRDRSFESIKNNYESILIFLEVRDIINLQTIRFKFNFFKGC